MSFVCPNEHPFPAMTLVGCEKCEAQVTTVPIAALLQMQDDLERAEHELATWKGRAIADAAVVEELKVDLAQLRKANEGFLDGEAIRDAHR